MELTACPECGLPAEVQYRYLMKSVEHGGVFTSWWDRTFCVGGHYRDEEEPWSKVPA